MVRNGREERHNEHALRPADPTYVRGTNHDLKECDFFDVYVMIDRLATAKYTTAQAKDIDKKNINTKTIEFATLQLFTHRFTHAHYPDPAQSSSSSTFCAAAHPVSAS